jgi:hypothetical protein
MGLVPARHRIETQAIFEELRLLREHLEDAALPPDVAEGIFSRRKWLTDRLRQLYRDED